MDSDFLSKLLNLKDVPCLLLPEMFKEACRYAKVEGLLMECGVFQGESSRDILAAYSEVFQSSPILYGFDSFLGLDEALTPMNPKGTTQLPDFEEYVAKYPISLYLITGKVQDTLVPFLGERSEVVSFINIDMTYTPTYYVLRTLAEHKRLVKGTVICIEQAIRPEKGQIYDGNYQAFIEAMKEFNITYKYIACADCHFVVILT